MRCSIRSTRVLLAGSPRWILLVFFVLLFALRARGEHMGRVFGRPLDRGAWVVPALLVGSGWLLVEGVHQSGANRAWTHQYARSREEFPYVDDAMQFLPSSLFLGMKLLGCDGATDSHFDMVGVSALSGLTLAVAVNGIKALRLSGRPDNSSWSSFPSGHTATVFWGAELLRREFGVEYPWLAAGAYGVAISTGFLRVYHRRHWIGDVIAGAGVGIASVWVGELLHSHLWDALHWWVRGRAARPLALSWYPVWDGGSVGVSVCCRF